jgi:FdrA protein
MIFSDNVPIADEVALKDEAAARGRLVMGPDCGTAIIGGVPLGFANAVPRGDVGLIGASGTGIQEVSCLLAHAGRGISHAIGTGGRDLKAEVGGRTMLAAIDLLDTDAATRHIVLISKPPAPDVLARILARVGRSPKRFTICMIGSSDMAMPDNARTARTHLAAVEDVIGRSFDAVADRTGLRGPAGRPLIRGLFAGGTLCAEAQVVLTAARGLGGVPMSEVVSNVPIPGSGRLTGRMIDATAHCLIDLGDDIFTRGRPHPMIEPAVRDEPLSEALADPRCGAILLDCVLGTGGHDDPGGHLAARLRNRAAGGPVVVASVTGTDRDAQVRSRQVAALERAGVVVAGSNAAAAEVAWRAVSGG